MSAATSTSGPTESFGWVIAPTCRCRSCGRHLPRHRFPLSGPARGRCLRCAALTSRALSTQRAEMDAYKALSDRVKRDEEGHGCATSPIFQLQDADVKYIVQSFWANQSVLCGCRDLEQLRLVRFYRDREWAPWNCVLLTEKEAEIHKSLDDLEKVSSKSFYWKRQSPILFFLQVYGLFLLQRIRHKHTLARNQFSKLASMNSA